MSKTILQTKHILSLLLVLVKLLKHALTCNLLRINNASDYGSTVIIDRSSFGKFSQAEKMGKTNWGSYNSCGICDKAFTQILLKSAFLEKSSEFITRKSKAY